MATYVQKQLLIGQKFDRESIDDYLGGSGAIIGSGETCSGCKPDD
jgi:hypothetical protein